MKFSIPTISEDQFWRIVEKGVIPPSDYSIKKNFEKLKSVLETLTDDELQSYELFRGQMYVKSYAWELWDAAFIINDGCGDDDFSDFRNGLIVQGEEVFYGAMKSPDTVLAALENAKYLRSCGCFGFISQEVWSKRKNLKDYDFMPIDYGKLFYSLTQPTGSSADEDELELQKKFPLLFKKYPSGEPDLVAES